MSITIIIDGTPHQIHEGATVRITGAAQVTLEQTLNGASAIPEPHPRLLVDYDNALAVLAELQNDIRFFGQTDLRHRIKDAYGVSMPKATTMADYTIKLALKRGTIQRYPITRLAQSDLTNWRAQLDGRSAAPRYLYGA